MAAASFTDPIERWTTSTCVSTACARSRYCAGSATTQGPLIPDVPVPAFGPRMVCTSCGIIGADGPAELAGAASARDADRHAMALSPRKRLGADQRRVLQLLARSTNGHTEAMLLAHGFTTPMLTVLVRDGLATATPETVRAGKRPMMSACASPTPGRQALAE
jgi:hypothetical protein